jgi:hypothetical protein
MKENIESFLDISSAPGTAVRVFTDKIRSLRQEAAYHLSRCALRLGFTVAFDATAFFAHINQLDDFNGFPPAAFRVAAFGLINLGVAYLGIRDFGQFVNATSSANAMTTAVTAFELQKSASSESFTPGSI